jgi:nucleoside-diphosphate-sugar epimerase
MGGMGRYPITGAAGFIGSHLAHALVARGEQVRCLDNYATGQKKNLADICDRVELCEIDLNDAVSVREACEGVDVVLHQGALPSVPRSVKKPRTSHETNIGGTFNVLEGARLAGVKRVVYAASSSAYGNQPGFPRVETMQPQPVSPYAVQKLAGELYMQSYWRVYGLETVCLRYFNIFGPRQTADSPYSGVMARFILQMLRGEQPVIFGDGEQGRDFTYVENVVSANLLAADGSATLIAGRVFNIACGERHTLNETYGKLAELLDYARGPEYGTEREGDVRDSLADISAAREALGYVPAVSFDEGLRRTVAWYREDFIREEAR